MFRSRMNQFGDAFPDCGLRSSLGDVHKNGFFCGLSLLADAWPPTLLIQEVRPQSWKKKIREIGRMLLRLIHNEIFFNIHAKLFIR